MYLSSPGKFRAIIALFAVLAGITLISHSPAAEARPSHHPESHERRSEASGERQTASDQGRDTCFVRRGPAHIGRTVEVECRITQVQLARHASRR